MPTKICKHCKKSFTPIIDDDHTLCCRCYRILHHQCVECGKPLSDRAKAMEWLNCYDCCQKNGGKIIKE